jgi:molecular chaperone GrpE
MGVESYGEVGDAFDPNLHNAIMQEDNEELGENVISDVFQKGYKRGEKIIRFAMVKVANCG